MSAALSAGGVLIVIFSAMVIWFRADLRDEIHLKIIERDAAVLYPMALQQVAESEARGGPNPFAPLTALLMSARQKGMLAVAVFDRDGNTIEAVPTTQLFVELPTDDYLRLRTGESITRYHPAFPLDQYFAGISREQPRVPVLEVLLPLPGPNPGAMHGFVRYYIDARALSQELALIDRRIHRQTAVTLGVGAILIAAVMTVAALRIQRVQRAIAERNERLSRANFELTLAAKASAVGQIASNLIHGLQGSVEGLRAVVASPDADPANPAWESAAGYTERLQTMIKDTVELLGDAGAHASYELSGRELATMIRDRNRAAAAEKGVALEVGEGFAAMIDSHRGGLLCLIANNLVQNSIAATERGRRVAVTLSEGDAIFTLQVEDEGAGIPEAITRNLFKPGRSGRPGRSGLGLAISQLLARQIGGEVRLIATSSQGTKFSVTLPRTPWAPQPPEGAAGAHS